MACEIVPQSTDHERLRFGLMNAGKRMWDSREQPDEFPKARGELVEFCIANLIPHLEHDDRWLLEAQHCAEGRLLAEAMRAEGWTMTATVNELSSTDGACELMALTRLLHTLLAAHDHHEKLLRTAASTV